MAGMFDNPFVFNRSGILGEQYSPKNLYPGMFGEGGTFAPGGMYGPPTQTISRETMPDFSILPVDGTPPGLIPWNPLPPQPPVEDVPEEEVPTTQFEEMPSSVRDYIQAMRRGRGFGRGHNEAINWIAENRQAMSPADMAALSSALERQRRANIQKFGQGE